MIDAQLNHRVLLENQLSEHRLVISVSAIELHRLIIGINAATLGDISLTIEENRLMARGHRAANRNPSNKGDDLYSRSFAKLEFVVEDLHLLVTQPFLNGILLTIRKFGVTGGHELIHFLVSKEEEINTENVINNLAVLIPPNHYHQNPVNSWKRINSRNGFLIPQKDKKLFDSLERRPSRQRVILPLQVFREIPRGNNLLAKSNGHDHWRFRRFSGVEPLIEIQREDWFRAFYRREIGTAEPDNGGDNFDVENLPDLPERALTVLADREVHRSCNRNT